MSFGKLGLSQIFVNNRFFTFLIESASISIDLFEGANLFNAFPRRDDRVADCASLERMCAGNGTEGSNPSLSAIAAPSPFHSVDALRLLMAGQRIKI